LVGKQNLTNGTVAYNNINYSDDLYTTNSNLDLSLSSGQVNGSSTQETDDDNSWNYVLWIKMDLNNDVLHSLMRGGGQGETDTDDGVNGSIANGTPTFTRTVTYTQSGDTASIIQANGNLTDNNGHTGSWTFLAVAMGNSDDEVTVYLSQSANGGWTETGRKFSIDEYSLNSSIYHEQDNGLGAPTPMPGETSSFSNRLDTTSRATQTTIENGTPNNYSFTINQSSSQSQTSVHQGSDSVPAQGDGWNSTSFSTTVKTAHDNREGTQVNGQRSLSSLDLYQATMSRGWSNNYNYSPQTESYSHNRYLNIFTLQKEGSTGPGGSGTGSQTTYIWQAMWGTTTTLGPHGQSTPWGNASGNAYEPPAVNLSWGANFQGTTTWDQLSADFWNDPGVQWLSANGGNLMQIGGGVADFLIGLGMTLGSCGGAVIPGVGLMAVGIDQILTGGYNMANPNSPSMSVFQYLGYSGAQSAGLSEGTSQIVGQFTPAALSIAFNVWGAMAACFAAGTPLLTPDGEKPIEQFKPGDWVLSAPEGDPEATPEPRQVEEVFTNLMPLLHVQVGGRTIRTTSEHPFYVRGKGWMAAKDLHAGDQLRSHDGQWKAVESVAESEGLIQVYNLRVAEHHTYFVGSRDWGFSVWAHNVCTIQTAGPTNPVPKPPPYGTIQYLNQAGQLV
jgi:hypothetical protein